MTNGTPKDKNQVIVQSLGGLSQVGCKNCYIVSFFDIDKWTAIMLDCGQEVSDRDEEALSFEHVPDFTRIPSYVEEVDAIFLSHGHLDHVGGIHKFIEFYSNSELFSDKEVPKVYMSSHTAQVLKKVIERRGIRHGELNEKYSVVPYIEEVEHFQTVKVGSAELFFFYAPHSIPGSLGCVLKVRGKKVLYTGDIKFHAPSWVETAQFAQVLAHEKVQDVDLLMLDVTGVDKPGTGESDSVVVESLLELINDNSNKRIFIAGFASSTARWRGVIQQLMRSRSNRQIVVHGGSMIAHVRYVADMRYANSYIYQNLDQRRSYPSGKQSVDDNAIIFLTGSQGEQFAALPRLVDEEYNAEMTDIHIRPQDLVIWAARAIPGNWEKVKELIQEIEKTGCEIVYPLEHDGSIPDEARKAFGWRVRYEKTHVSGHGYRKDLEDLVRSFNPAKLMPIHAEFDRRKMARDLMPNPADVFLPEEEYEQIVI